MAITDDENNDDTYKRITNFIFAVIVNLIICIVMGIFYISIYYNFLLPRPELNVMYPENLGHYISVIKQLAQKQKQNIDSDQNNKEPEIEVDFKGRGEGTRSGYTDNQKYILENAYRETEEREELLNQEKIKISTKGLFSLTNVMKIWEGLCKANPDYKESEMPWISCKVPDQEIKTKTGEFEDCPSVTTNPGEESKIESKLEDFAKRAKNPGDTFSNITKTTMNFCFTRNPDDPSRIVIPGWPGGIGGWLLFIIRVLVAIVVWVVVFVITFVLGLVALIVVLVRNILFGCWGSGMWGKGTFNTFINMLLLYTDVSVGKWFNLFISKTWFGRYPLLGITFGLLLLFIIVSLVGLWYMMPFGAISMYLSKKFNVGGFGTWSILYLFLGALIPLRIASLFVYYCYKLFIKGCVNPENPELRNKVFASSYVKVPLRIIFIILTLIAGQRTLTDTMFIGLAVIGGSALLADMWFFIKNIF